MVPDIPKTQNSSHSRCRTPTKRVQVSQPRLRHTMTRIFPTRSHVSSFTSTASNMYDYFPEAILKWQEWLKPPKNMRLSILLSDGHREFVCMEEHKGKHVALLRNKFS